MILHPLINPFPLNLFHPSRIFNVSIHSLTTALLKLMLSPRGSWLVAPNLWPAALPLIRYCLRRPLLITFIPPNLFYPSRIFNVSIHSLTTALLKLMLSPRGSWLVAPNLWPAALPLIRYCLRRPLLITFIPHNLFYPLDFSMCPYIALPPHC